MTSDRKHLDSLQIPPLKSGGLMLSYRCTNRCRHCLYRCSPRQANDWMTIEIAEQALAALAEEPQLDGIHIAGGEAMLQPDLVEQVIRLAVQYGVPIDYLETNAFWSKEPENTRMQLERLRDAGLPAILVSVSLFHNEFIPFSNTKICVDAAREIFGPRGVIVYQPQMYGLLDSLEGDGRHKLEDSCAELGVDADSSWVPESFGVIPSGRAVEDLRSCYRASPPESFSGKTCVHDLLNTTHFHIDPYGNLFTGLCPGIRMASIYDLHPPIEKKTHPITHRLITDGPYVLMLEATTAHGFEPRPTGYVSKCDLCADVRQHLWKTGRYSELQPEAFYSEP